MFPGSRAARPAPPPWRGRRRARGCECGRRAPCGAGRGPAGGRAGAWVAGPRARGPGTGAPGRPRAGLLASSAASELEVFCYYYFHEGQARRRPSPKGAEALLGGRGGRREPARLWHDCRALGCHFVTVAVVAGGGGGAESCAIAPTAPDVEAAGEAGSRDPRLCSGPRGGLPPCDNGLRLCWSVAAAVAPGGRRSSPQVLPRHPPSRSLSPPAPLLASVSPFLPLAF